ncbi:MAG: CPBP family intramembrane metalloprotease [Candidatus Heimdallarchaeota archaeon]|nr:CPBP family intramembrane metalloprotease [Candidatus Heimdallarchaeota archaeon]
MSETELKAETKKNLALSLILWTLPELLIFLLYAFNPFTILNWPLYMSSNIGNIVLIIILYYAMLIKQMFPEIKEGEIKSYRWSISQWFAISSVMLLGAHLIESIGFSKSFSLRIITQFHIETISVLSILMYIIVLGPIAEELVFRRVLIPLMEQFTTERKSLIVSAIIFSSIHWAGDLLSNMTIFSARLYVTVILGLLLGYIYQKTRNIKFSIAVHMLHNFFVMIPDISSALFYFTEQDYEIYAQGGSINSSVSKSIFLYNLTLILYWLVIFSSLGFGLYLLTKHYSSYIESIKLHLSDLSEIFSEDAGMMILAFIGLFVVFPVFITFATLGKTGIVIKANGDAISLYHLYHAIGSIVIILIGVILYYRNKGPNSS